ncbi:MAG: DUF99 family protein [Myxococcales bacterium]|nr:DUF99 family protein [Myxococcales bacterium]
MKELAQKLSTGRTLRVLGVDDAPFAKRRGARVSVCGVVCAGHRFEGMLWAETRRDGWGATDALIAAVTASKFAPQLDLVLLDGIALGGFNVVDLPRLAEAVARPCVAVMRRAPSLDAVHAAMAKLPGYARRSAVMARAGEIYTLGGHVFQVQGGAPAVIAEALTVLTREGKVPEALRLAHLIGSAVKLGESRRRA